MRFHMLTIIASAVLLSACEKHASAAPETTTTANPPTSAMPAASARVVPTSPDEIQHSVVRVATTSQSWNPGQPWEKQSSNQRESLGAVLSDHRVLTTAEMAADATYVELETVDGLKRIPAHVIAIDYEANLALLGPLDDKENPQSNEASESTPPNGDFFTDLTPLTVADTPTIDDQLEIIQVRDNGTPLLTPGPIQSIDMISTLVASKYFLTYQVKASMQSAASSFSLPVIHQGKLAGMLTNYDSDDQLSDIIATEIIRAFLDDAADGNYDGFPSLGIAATSTEDENFRRWLGLDEDHGGLFIATVEPNSAAAAANLQPGDVLLAVDDLTIDRQGYIDHPLYKRLFWSHQIHGPKTIGENVNLDILRDGSLESVTATLTRSDPQDALIPPYTYGHAPRYLVKGGMIFQELTQPLLSAFGDNWTSRAPLNLLDPWENPDKYRDDYDRIVFLSGVIATPATVGYERLRNLIIKEINGQPIRDIPSLIAAFAKVPASGHHTINFRDEDLDIYLDELLSSQVDTQLLQRGLPKLSRAK